MDDVVMLEQGSRDVIETNFSQGVDVNQLPTVSGGSVQQLDDGLPALRLESLDSNHITEFRTTPVALDPEDGLLVQFDYMVDSLDARVVLEYSSLPSSTWLNLFRSECNPTSTICGNWKLDGSTTTLPLFSHIDKIGSWHRFSYRVFDDTKDKIRFRVRQEGTGVWAIRNLYIGSGCGAGCGNLGACQKGVCICDPGSRQLNSTCVRAVPAVASTFKATFEDEESSLESDLWSVAEGATVGGQCQVISESQNLEFVGGRERRLETGFLDLTEIGLLEFLFQDSSGDCRSRSSTRNPVVVAVTTDNGLSYTKLRTITSRLLSSVFFRDTIPLELRLNQAKIIWWQATAKSSTNYGDWVSEQLFFKTDLPVGSRRYNNHSRSPFESLSRFF